MKVKDILKALKDVDYCIISESGMIKDTGYVDEMGHDSNGASPFEDADVIKTTIARKWGTLVITIPAGAKPQPQHYKGIK